MPSPFAAVRYASRLVTALRGTYNCTCPVCGYEGKFRAAGVPPTINARCPKCGTLPRHRLLVLADKELDLFPTGGSLLHFAPEKCVQHYLAGKVSNYVTTDLFRSDVDRNDNIEHMEMDSDAFDRVLCSHVLEHVDDGPAMRELYRVVKPGGVLIAMVPIVEGWKTTYENDAIANDADRERHFGRHNHVRFYGADFRDRLRAVGFDVREFKADGPATVKYALARGETVFICKKPS